MPRPEVPVRLFISTLSAHVGDLEWEVADASQRGDLRSFQPLSGARKKVVPQRGGGASACRGSAAAATTIRGRKCRNPESTREELTAANGSGGLAGGGRFGTGRPTAPEARVKGTFRPLCRPAGGEGVNPAEQLQSSRKKSPTRRPDMFLPESDDEFDYILSGSESPSSSSSSEDL